MADLQTTGTFDRIKGKIRSTWGDLTDDDMARAQGDAEQLAGIIKEKTGEGLENIRRKISEMLDHSDANEAHRAR